MKKRAQSDLERTRPIVLILAAGLGTRMKSARAKVLHELGGSPLIVHVLKAAHELKPAQICIVVGHQAAEVEAAARREANQGELAFVIQESQRGTGDAVMAARAHLKGAEGTVLVLAGDVPLIQPETLDKFVAHHLRTKAACSILSVNLENPTGYGRVVRDESDGFLKIVEQKDASPSELTIKEINSGIYCFELAQLFEALELVKPNNVQGEYYLTDVPSILAHQGASVELYLHNDSREVAGINTRAELAEFENLLRRGTVRRLMLEGVTFIDPSHVYIGSQATIGRDCIVYPNVAIEGKSVIGESCVIRSGSRITDSRIGDNVTIKDHCIIVDSEIGANCSVGPFAHLRMNAVLEDSAAVGNFVELKKSRLGRGSKSMHLTYLGDAKIGKKTNIGAGTITCNYDGKRKHETIIEDNVKIGSDTMLVAPVRVGDSSVTAAGSVVIDDVPPGSLVAGVPAVVKKRLKSE